MVTAAAIDYFALLGIEPRYSLDSAELDSAYRVFAARWHPDRYLNAEPAVRARAFEAAAAANEGYRTLKRPALRARHLLGLRGVETGTAASSSAAMLAEQMEWREALEDAGAAGDIVGIDRLECIVMMRACFLRARLAAQLDVERDHAGAVRAVEELFFVDKLLDAIADARAALEPG